MTVLRVVRTDPTRLQPKQMGLLEFMEMRDGPRIFLYGGAMGGAKSFAVDAVNLIRRERHPGTVSLIFRRTLPELRNNHIEPMFRTWPQLREFWTENKRLLTLPNGSQTYFGSADNEDDMARFQGIEFADEFIDEGQQLEYPKIQFLRTRNRTTVRGIKPCQVITANPGGVSHAELKRLFVDRRFSGRERASDYHFIQARAHDNVQWSLPALEEDGLTEEDYYGWPDDTRFAYFLERSEYGRTMDAMPEKQRNAFLLGRWDVFSGQFFDCFDAEQHPLPFEALGIQKWHPRWISIDWGWSHRTAVYFHAQLEGGRIATYRELTMSRTSPEAIAKEIGDLCRLFREKPVAVYLSHDAFGEKTDEKTIAQRMAVVFEEYGIPEPQLPVRKRTTGARLMYDLLAERKWLIARTCRELIACLPTLVHDPDDTEDVLKVDGDDPYDGARYGIVVPGEHITVPIEVEVMESLSRFEKDDFTSRNAYYQKALYDRDQKQLNPVSRSRRLPIAALAAKLRKHLPWSPN